MLTTLNSYEERSSTTFCCKIPNNGDYLTTRRKFITYFKRTSTSTIFFLSKPPNLFVRIYYHRMNLCLLMN